MKVVYTLVSSQSDYYLEQFCYSAFSVKRVSPNAEITLVVDEQTNRSFVGVRETEASIADEIISVSYPENMTSKQRSRMLKTMLMCHKVTQIREQTATPLFRKIFCG